MPDKRDYVTMNKIYEIYGTKPNKRKEESVVADYDEDV